MSDDHLPILARDNVPPTACLAALVDVETTGLNPSKDRVVEFAGVLFAFDRSKGALLGRVYEYSSLNDPGISIPRDATAVNGITDGMVKGHRLDPRMVDGLLSEAEFIVAHNASFDYGFVAPLSEVARSKPWRCSMRDINWMALGHRSVGLQQLLRDHGIRPTAAHRALDDVRCALRLLARCDADGISYLKSLERINYDRELPGTSKPTQHETTSPGSERAAVPQTQVHRGGRSAPAGEAFKIWMPGELQAMLRAADRRTNPVDRHFLLVGIVEATYKQRRIPAMRELFLKYAAKHTQEFRDLAPSLKAEFDETLPLVPTFQKYATVLAEEGRFDEAVQVCELALSHGLEDGTESGFEGRITRIRKKQMKATK